MLAEVEVIPRNGAEADALIFPAETVRLPVATVNAPLESAPVVVQLPDPFTAPDPAT